MSGTDAMPTTTTAPPQYLYPYCDWFVVVTHCPYDDVHWPFKVLSLVLSVLAVLVACLYLGLRYKNGHTIVLSKTVAAVDGTILILTISNICRAIDAGLIITDTYINFMARYVFMTTGWIIAFQAPVFFLYAVAHSIPNAYLDRTGMMHSTLLPPRWIFVSYCLFESVGCLLCITGSGVYLGFLFERGGLEETHQGYISLFSFWSIFLTLLAIAFWYYCNRLMAVVQDNNATGRTRNAAMIRAVKRMKLMIYGMAPLELFMASITILMAILHMEIFQNTVGSLIVAFVFHTTVQLLLLISASVLLVMEVRGLLSDTDNYKSSSFGKKGGITITSNGRSKTAAKNRSNDASAILQEALASAVELEEHQKPLSLGLLVL